MVTREELRTRLTRAMTTRGTRRPACDVTAQEKLWSPAPCASAARGPSRPSPPSRSSLRREQARREKGGPDLRGWNILRSSISPRKRRLRKNPPAPSPCPHPLHPTHPGSDLSPATLARPTAESAAPRGLPDGTVWGGAPTPTLCLRFLFSLSSFRHPFSEYLFAATLKVRARTLDLEA